MQTIVKYRLVEKVENAAFLVLEGNGQPCECPFNPIVPTQQDGKVIAGRVPCNSGCPLAEIKVEKIPLREEAGEMTDGIPGQSEKATGSPAEKYVYSYIIHCGANPVKRDVEIKPHSNIQAVPLFPLNHQ